MLWGSIIKIEILQTTWKNKTKNIKILNLLMELKSKGLMFIVSFFHVICKISNFNTYVNRKAFGTSFLYWVDFKAIFGYLAKKVIMKRNSNSFFFQAVTISVYLAKVVFNRLKSDKVFFLSCCKCNSKKQQFS